MFGCAGCNSIMGTARVNQDKQTIGCFAIGSTLMLCANMEYEQQILDALHKVKAYKNGGDGLVNLTNSRGKTVLTLKKQ